MTAFAISGEGIGGVLNKLLSGWLVVVLLWTNGLCVGRFPMGTASVVGGT